MQSRLPLSANIIVLLLICIVALIFFYPTFFLGFIYDDWGDLFNAYGNIGDRLREFLPMEGDFRAVTRLFWWLSYQLFGTEPLGYHLLNFGIHLLIIIMVWRLARLLTNNDWVGLCAAFLFSINLTTITPVSWVSATIDQKLLLFGLLAVFVYIRTARLMEASGRYPFGFILIFTLTAWFAFKSKLMAWPLPAIYLLVDFTYLNSTENIKSRMIGSALRWLKITWPLHILTLIYIPYFLAWAGPINSSGEYGVSFSPLNYLSSYKHYLGRALGMNDYFGGAVGVVLFLYVIFNKNRNVLFGVLWFSITLTPVAILTRHHFDHHVYLPLFGLVLALASMLVDAIERIKMPLSIKSRVAIFGILAGLYAYVMHPFFTEWTEKIGDAPARSRRTLSEIKTIVPTVPENVTFFVYPTPKFSLLNYSAPLNFLYQKFNGITIKLFDNPVDFQNAIQAPTESAWYALRYEPSDGSVVLVKSNGH
jgi:hypothetical protein